MVNGNGKGGFKSLSKELRAQLLGAFIDSRFQTLSQIAQHFHISKSVVIKYRDEFVKSNVLSKNNWHVVKVVKPRPLVRERLALRRKEMLFHIFGGMKDGKKVSVNELQKKFGGEKKFAAKVISEVEGVLASRKKFSKWWELKRRTVSDQPRRKQIKHDF